MKFASSSPAFKLFSSQSKLLALVIILALTSGRAWSQVVIPASRFPTAVGDSFVSFTNRDSLHVSYDPGASSWDFSSGPQADTSVSVSISSSRTPQPDSFPLAQLFERSFRLSDTAASYTYGTKTADSLFSYGTSVPDTLPGHFLVLRWLPDQKYFSFPLQTGVSWTSIDSISLGEYMGYRTVLIDTFYGRVIKEGTVTGPFGGPYPCLLTRVSQRGLAILRPINLILDSVYQETANWVVPDWGVVVTINSAVHDTSWPITRASGFTRLWQFNQVGVEENTSRQTPYASRVSLGPAFPNPMRDHTVISFSAPLSLTPYPASLSIYDPTGRLVRVLTSNESGITSHSFAWDGRDREGRPVGSGVYFYRLEAGSFTATKKLVVVR